MIDRAVKDHGLDPRRVYVTGLSSGGAMTSVMLATYPDVFAGGAVLAGVPYRSADNMQEAFESIFQGRNRTPREWGDLVREASPHQGPWPRVSVWHGDADSAVKPTNADEIVKQWTDVHGVAGSPHLERTLDGHPHRVWHGADREHLVESYTISGMSHGAPLSTGDQPHQCGTAAPFFNDVGISSAYHIAKFWGLLEMTLDASVSASTSTNDRAQPEVIDLSRASVVKEPGQEPPEQVLVQDDTDEVQATSTPPRDEGAAAESGETGGPSESAAGGVLVDSSEPVEGQTTRESDDRANDQGSLPLGIDVHGIVRKSLEAAGLIKEGAQSGEGARRLGGMPFGLDIPGIIGTSLEAAGVFRESVADTDTRRSGKETADSGWEGEGWQLLANDPGTFRDGPMLFGQVSSGQECDVGKKVRSTSRKVSLGPRPELSYVRRLNLNAAVNDYTSASFSVLVDGTPVDEASAVGMEHVEAEWLQRSDIDLSRYADRTVTLTFEVTANANVCSEVSAKAWIDRIRIKSVSPLS
jgi:hypothetical protein